MHGGMKVYRGSPTAARNYVEADRSRADDYYLAEGTGIADRYVATHSPESGGCAGDSGVQDGGTLDGDAYEAWVAGYEVDMLWRPQRLVVELDGRAYHEDTFEEDRERDASLTAAGLRVVRVTWRRLTRHEEREAARFGALLA